jgi:hypothetical protein
MESWNQKYCGLAVGLARAGQPQAVLSASFLNSGDDPCVTNPCVLRNTFSRQLLYHNPAHLNVICAVLWTAGLGWRFAAWSDGTRDPVM